MNTSDAVEVLRSAADEHEGWAIESQDNSVRQLQEYMVSHALLKAALDIAQPRQVRPSEERMK